MVNKRRYLIFFIAFSSLLFGVPAAFADFISNFDTDDEGWTIYDGSGSMDYDAVNGWLEVEDTNLNNALQISAPSNPFLNNLWQPYDGGTLSFQAHMLNDTGEGAWGGFGEVTLTGTGGSFTSDLYDPVQIIPDTPTTFSVDLLFGNFGATEDQWNSLLGNQLTSVVVNLEAQRGIDDVIGFDNFEVRGAAAAPVPEPSIALLFGSGLLGLLGAKRVRLRKG